MTEAGWTGNAPTKEGWYWWKRTENDNPVIVWVNAFHTDKQLRAEMISGRRELLTHFTGLFNGPITPTDRQQGRVAGLKEASKLADEYGAEEWSNTCVQDAMARLSLRIDKRIEQAAQDEKGVGDVHQQEEG